MVQSMKQMAAEMHNELESTRTELRRGVLEMPQEAAESTAQMRKVIVDQIEALAELNRIVARHGRGLDVVGDQRATASVQREEEPRWPSPAAAARARRGRRRRLPRAARPRDIERHHRACRCRISVGPAPRRTEAPSVAPASSDQGRDGWLSDLLGRADHVEEEPNAAAPARTAPPQPCRVSQSAGIAVARHRPADGSRRSPPRCGIATSAASARRSASGSTRRPARRPSTRSARKYRSDRNFKRTVDRYVTEFERLLDEVARDERGPAALRSHLTSETGLVYTLLAHAAGRLG